MARVKATATMVIEFRMLLGLTAASGPFSPTVLPSFSIVRLLSRQIEPRRQALSATRVNKVTRLNGCSQPSFYHMTLDYGNGDLTVLQAGEVSAMVAMF
jgi:hypothetical protein